MYEGDSLDIKLSEVGETTSKTYYCFVKSLAGNTGKNSKSVKVDITKPVITDFEISSQSSSYNTSQVNFSLKANDLTSGLSKMCISETNNVNSCSWKDFSESSTYDIVDGYSTGEAVYFYAWVKDNAGNVSVVARPDKVLDARNDIPASPNPDSIYPDSIPYIPYKECSETVNDGTYTCGTYSGCTNVCGGGTEYATKTQKKKDKYTGATCSSVITESGCSQSCGGTNTNYTYGSWSSWSTCSDACGGTQTRTRTGYRYSTDGTKICSDAKTETDTQNCGGQATETCGDYGSFSTCSNVCGGTQTQSKTCTIKSMDGTKVCSTRTVENTVNCGGANVSCGSCSANSGATCSTTCGTGTKAGTQTCTNISTIDNSYCSAAASQSCTVSCTDNSGCTKPSKPTITAKRKYTADDNYLKAGDVVASGNWSNGLNFTFSGSTATGGVGYQYSFDKSSWTTASTLSYTTVTSSKKIYVRAYNLIKTSLVSDIVEYTIKLETTKPTVTSFGSTSTCSSNKNPSGVSYPQQYGAGDWADSGGSGLKSVTMVYSFTYKSKSYCSYYFNSSLSGNSSPNQGYWVKYKGPTKFFLRVCDAAGNCVSTTGSSSCSGSVKKNISDGATYIDSCAAYIS